MRATRKSTFHPIIAPSLPVSTGAQRSASGEKLIHATDWVTSIQR
jgi:hypothetical protein